MIIPDYWKENVSGASLVAMKVGGTVAYLAQPKTNEQLVETMALIKGEGLSWRALGGGSDLLLPDGGFPGVLVQPKFASIGELDAEGVAALGLPERYQGVAARYNPEQGEEFLHLSGHGEALDAEPGYVYMGAGVPWGQAVTSSLRLGFGGLHVFARIPCYVGGALYNNIHGAEAFLSDYVAAVYAFDPATGQEVKIMQPDAEFGYDASIFHRLPLIITGAVFRLPRVGTEATAGLLAKYMEWTKEKTRVQPSGANAGSTFKNITREEMEAAGGQSLSAGWYVDHAGLKGLSVGGMQVYPGHGNFIVNTGTGTQADFIALVLKVREKVHARYGLWLQPEVECLDPAGNLILWPTSS